MQTWKPRALQVVAAQIGAESSAVERTAEHTFFTHVVEAGESEVGSTGTVSLEELRDVGGAVHGDHGRTPSVARSLTVYRERLHCAPVAQPLDEDDGARLDRAQGWLTASSEARSPAMRVCHIRRGWVMSNGVARCMSRRLSQMTASPPSPLVVMIARWLAGLLDELVEEALGLVGVHADDAVGVAADHRLGRPVSGWTFTSGRSDGAVVVAVAA